MNTLATNDYISLNDNFTLSDDAQIQCVPIEIVSDSVTEPGQECFTFSISSPTTVGGLQVSPSEAEICISDEEGKKYNTQIKREREREGRVQTHNASNSL